MVSKFNTAAPAATTTKTAGGSNALLWAVGIGVGIWLGYEFWYKPTYILPKQQQQK